MSSSALPSREALFSSPFASQSFATPRTARRAPNPSFPLCTIQLLHQHTPHTLSYYSAPPHLPPTSPVFSHLLSAFGRSVEQLLGAQPVAYEGTDGLLYPPAVMLQLPDMMEGRSFKVVLPAPSSTAAATAGVETAGGTAAEQSLQRLRRKQKKSVSFGQLVVPEQTLRTHSTPAAHSNFTSAPASSKPALSISTAYHNTAQLSPMSPSPQSPTASPLPPSLLVPSSFPLPSYTTSIPLLRSILSRAFQPSVTLEHMSVLFVHYASASTSLLPRSAFLPLVSTALRATSATSRSAAVLQCFLSHLFTWLDDDSDEQVTEPQFIAGMALLLPATTGADKLAISFRLLDRFDSGFITPTALFSAAVTFTNVLLSLAHPPAHSTSASASPSAIPFRSSFDVPSLVASTYEIAGKVVREAFGCGDANLDQRLSSEEYTTLHISRPSCLPWVNVLIDPEAVLINAAPAAVVVPGTATAQRGVGRQSGAHERSASLPMRVDLSDMLRQQKRWNLHTTGHRDARKALHGQADEEEEDEEEEEEDDDEEEEDDEEDDDEDEDDEKLLSNDVEEDAANEEGDEADAVDPQDNASARAQPPADSSDELEIDSVVQQKMLEFAMSQSGGSKRSAGRGGSGGSEEKRILPVNTELSERDADDIERTEAFLEAMYDELRRVGLQPSHNGVDSSNNQRTPAKTDAEQRATNPYSLLLSATVTAPRLSSLCSSSSFQSIQPHVAPFAVLRLEQLLELFHLLTSHQDRLARADLARLASTLSIGQSSASHATMLDTLHQLFTWIDSDEDDEIATADIVLALSGMVGADGREQVNVGFALCDHDGDGRLTVVEVERYLVDVMGAYFSLTEQWNTLVRLTKQEAEERLNRKKAALLLQQQQQARKEAENKASAAAEQPSEQTATAAATGAEEKSQFPTAVAAADSPDEQQSQFNSSRPASPSFSLSILRREVSSLLINAATTAASHCFTVHTHPPLGTGTSIDAQRLWEWMDAVRVEAADKERAASGLPGSRPSSSGGWRDKYPLFDVVKALYVLL